MQRSFFKAIACLFSCVLLLLAGASLAQELKLRVSGDIVKKQLLSDFILASLQDLLSGEAGVLDLKKIPSDLRPGETSIIDLKKEHGLLVIAQNIGLPKMDDSLLVVSNDPEEIEGPGVLLSEELRQEEPLRVLYYHKGVKGKDLFLYALIQNFNPYPVDVFITKGAGGPCEDGIYAGHAATLRYMEQEKDGAGFVMTVPANSSTVVLRHPLKEGQVSTGIIRLRQISGGATTLKVAAASGGGEPRERLRGKEDGRFSGVIEQAYIDVEKKYFIGSSPLDIRIGESPTFSSKKGGFDIHLGNYGMMHRIGLEIENPSNRSKTASIYYIASGGPARGVFLAEGLIIQTKLLDPKGKRSEKILSVEVKKGEKKCILIKMMPEPGSFYPTRLVVLEEKS